MKNQNQFSMNYWKTNDNAFTFLFGVKGQSQPASPATPARVLVQVDHRDTPATDGTRNPFFLSHKEATYFSFFDQASRKQVRGKLSMRLGKTNEQAGIWAEVTYGPAENPQRFEGMVCPL